ncbi:MAG: DUF4331 family protein [Hymenobacter sp.]
MQFIPNMDGFPNGRRLEDDVTRIELQAVSGVVLAALGLWYDDYRGWRRQPRNGAVWAMCWASPPTSSATTPRSKPRSPTRRLPWSGTTAQTHGIVAAQWQRLGHAAQAGLVARLPQPLRGPHHPALRIDSRRPT